MKLLELIDKTKVRLDKNGIWTTDFELSDDSKKSQKVWRKIYNFNLKKLKADRIDFYENKLVDHVFYVEKAYRFTRDTVYLEIGCGPAYIGEYVLKRHKCYFIGIDFNYQVLASLKKYFDEVGLNKYVLIHADISHMPIKSNCIDFIYGGGVIEHFKDTFSIVKELFRVLKNKGVCFNTVPALNIMWLLRYDNNIPSIPFIKQFMEYLHINILNSKYLERHHGYELSYTLNQLSSLHKKIGFKRVTCGTFAFHPSSKKSNNQILRKLYYVISKIPLLSPIYYVAASK